MIFTIRTTTGRENVVIESLSTKAKKNGIEVRSLFHPTELRGYIFAEGEQKDVESLIKGVPHIRGIINKPVEIRDIEKFLIPEKNEIKIELGDVVEITGGPFKGEKGKVTRTDDTKNEITVEFLEATIPIPVTISINSVRIHEKKK